MVKSSILLHKNRRSSVPLSTWCCSSWRCGIQTHPKTELLLEKAKHLKY